MPDPLADFPEGPRRGSSLSDEILVRFSLLPVLGIHPDPLGFKKRLLSAKEFHLSPRESHRCTITWNLHTQVTADRRHRSSRRHPSTSGTLVRESDVIGLLACFLPSLQAFRACT